MIDPRKLMRGVILALAILVAAPFAGSATPFLGVEAAQAATVTNISVSGNSRVDKATIISYLTLKVGEQLTAAKISSSIDALYKTGLFRTVNITASGSTVYVKVTENAIVASVLFEGNQRFSDQNLLDLVDVGTRGTYSPETLQQDIASIKAAYNQVGYTAATVTARTEPVDNGRMRVVFVINEGTRAGVAGINFTGNNSVSGGVLKSVIKTKETGFLSWLLRDDNYTPEQLQIDRELIRRYYNDHGFPDAQVTAATAEYDASRNGYFINFTIMEGDRYTFGQNGIETSISGLQTDNLKNSIETSSGGTYSYTKLQKSADDMAFQATNQGYAFADVRPRIDRDTTNHVFNVTYLVDQGPRVYVERINITGNDKTRDFVIRRELDFAEGDPFNRNLVTRGKTNIENLGFFKSVDISTQPGSAPDKIIININVVEQSTGQYGLTAGYSTTDGILGEVSVTERNFLGRGQYVRAAIGATGTGKTFDFSFTEPRFMGLKISSGIDLYNHITDESSTNYYGVNVLGGQVRFGIPVTDYVTTTVFAGLEQRTYKDESAPFSALVTDGTVRNKAFGGITLAYNNLDDQKHPTTGLVAQLSTKYVGWDSNFVQTEGKARYFVPLFEDQGVIGSVRAQAGVINDLSGNGLNALDAFKFNSNLVRGFEANGFGAVLAAPSGEYIGGTYYAGLSAEVQFPIPMLPPSYGLSGAVFADAAVIGGLPNIPSGFSVDPASTDQPFKSSVGASIIWDSPFGPLRGDFAYALTKASSDKPQIFQLSLQTLL